MSEVRKLHDEAMALAEMASVAKLRGDLEQAGKLLRQAYGKESKAAELITHELSLEPTRSILFRSAASLAIDCNELREAERLIATALSGNPPAPIAEELRDLLEQVNFSRHLDLRGITLAPEELQMSIAGRTIGVGMAPSEHRAGARPRKEGKMNLNTQQRHIARHLDEGTLKARFIPELHFVEVKRGEGEPVRFGASQLEHLPHTLIQAALAHPWTWCIETSKEQGPESGSQVLEGRGKQDGNRA